MVIPVIPSLHTHTSPLYFTPTQLIAERAKFDSYLHCAKAGGSPKSVQHPALHFTR